MAYINGQDVLFSPIVDITTNGLNESLLDPVLALIGSVDETLTPETSPSSFKWENLSENAVVIASSENTVYYFDFVSDYIPTASELVGGKIYKNSAVSTIYEENSSYTPKIKTLSTENGDVLSINDGDYNTSASMALWYLKQRAVVIPADNTTINIEDVDGGAQLTFAKAGIYFALYLTNSAFVDGVTQLDLV